MTLTDQYPSLMYHIGILTRAETERQLASQLAHANDHFAPIIGNDPKSNTFAPLALQTAASHLHAHAALLPLSPEETKATQPCEP